MTNLPSRPGGTRRPVGRRDLARPDVERLIRLVAVACLEVLTGRRPARQLDPLVSPSVGLRLRAKLRATQSSAARALVRSVLADWPDPDACEATVLLDHGERTTALALRAERHLGGWRIVELAAPEDGFPATSSASLPADHRPPDSFDTS